MRTLHLLRHAKSSWADEGLPDHDRPLAPRGRRAGRRMAEHVRERGIAPDVVLCSSARRALETLALVAPALGPQTRTLVEERLYGADAADLLERLHRLPASTASAMLIGHNPALQDLALELAGAGPAVPRLRLKFPTGALATLRLRVEWADAGPGDAELVDLAVPREL